MLKSITEWITTRENVTLLIAVAGLVLSLWNTTEAHFKNRKNVQISIQDVFRAGPDPKGMYAEILNLTFINKSREAITLSGLSVECDGKTHQFGEYRQMLLENRHSVGKIETSRSTWFSDTFPQKIEGLGYVHMILSATAKEFCIEPQKTYVLTLYTNKGKIKKDFTSDIADLYKLSDCRAPDWHTEALKD